MTTQTSPAATAPPDAAFMGRWRGTALRVLAAIVALSTAVAFGESYRALYLWAAHHGVPGAWAFTWPAMVDTFVAVGELALFVGMVDRWRIRHRAWAWCVTFGGLAVSVAGNVGHVGAAPWTWRLTAAVPPVAAFVALTVALGVLKRVTERAAILAGEDTGADLADVERRAVLAAAETDAARVRYAFAQTGRTEIAPAREWLLTYGYDIPEVNIMSVLRRLTDKSPVELKPINGADLSGELTGLPA